MKFLFAIALGASAFIGGIGLNVTSGWLITMASEHPPVLTLTVAIVLVRFFGISRSVARYGERIMSHAAVLEKLTDLRVALYQRVITKKVIFARDLNSGLYVKGMVDDVDRAQEYQLRILLPGWSAFISLLTGVALVYWVRPESIWITSLTSLLLLLLLPSFIRRICTRYASAIEHEENGYAQQLQASGNGLIEAEVYGYLNRSQQESARIENEIAMVEEDLLRRSFLLQLISSAILGGSILATIVLIYFLSRTEVIPSVQITMSIFVPLVIYEAITAWYPNLYTSGKILTAQKRIESLLNENLDKSKEFSLEESVHSFVAKDVTASWNRDFMRPVSFSLTPGDVLIIRGASGSGKSTLALAMLGMLPYKGSFALNGVEISHLDLNRYISGTLQSTHIFNTTIRENLKIANQVASDQEIVEVLNLVELESISLDTVVGEFGRPLSGGEAKRLAIARVLLSPAPIYLFDEPTEHLDRDLAQRIEERVRQRSASKILIVITHSGWGTSDPSLYLQRE